VAERLFSLPPATQRTGAMPGSPKQCRRHALACMQISQASAPPDVREHFAGLARTWLRLAGDIESGQALIDLLDDLEREPQRRFG
jgi:hypothetical protein